MWSFIVFLTLLECTVGTVIGKTKKNVHHLMTRREIEVYFGVKDHSEIPEYDVITPRETESNGRVLSHFRRKRNLRDQDVLHYKLHAFGSKLQIRLKRNLMLMAPNLVIETHHGGELVTTQSAPRNKFFLGKVSSDPDSLVAMRSDKGLTGMIRTSGKTFFVQPLPSHLAKRVRRSADTIPHLIYRGPPLKRGTSGCQAEKSVNDRLKRSTHLRKPRATNSSSDGFKYMEAALIVSQSFVDKYHKDNYTNVLLVIANMVAGMYQDPSIGKYKVYYVVTKIIHITSEANQLNFLPGDPDRTKMTKLANWASKYIKKPDSDPDHFDVFSYVTDKMSGGRAMIDQMCKSKSGNMNQDIGLQSSLTIAHEIGHNLNLGHDISAECPPGTYIMSATLPGGVLAATWSNCSRRSLEDFIGNDNRAKCLLDPPLASHVIPNPPSDQNKLPGEIFDGNYQCEMQYGPGFIVSPSQRGRCDNLFCTTSGGGDVSRLVPLADGSPCGIRNWCIGGRCQDNGKKRHPGGWSSWSYYRQCTYSCGGGVQYRTRECTSPPPKYGGATCVGPSKEWRICNSAPCARNVPTYREQQCAERQAGSSPYTRSPGCGSLFCITSNVVRSSGNVNTGTRCSFNKAILDVCIDGQCRNVGCDHKLDSYVSFDRWGVCGGNGDSYFKVDTNYSTQYKVKGPENADLIAELVVGTRDVFFQFKSATVNNLGVQAANGTYLVGGHLQGKNQAKQAAGTTIVYTNKKNKFKDVLTIAGPTNALLRVMYIFEQGANPGVLYRYTRPPQAGDPPSSYEWKNETWSSCSATCGDGVQTRLVSCVRSDDETPASNSACDGKSKPATKKGCPGKSCPPRWITTPWSDCSRSCGNGHQTRKVQCITDLTSTKSTPSNKCSNANKPVENDTLQSCNSFDCYPDWDTKDGFDTDECGDPIDPALLNCYRRDHSGERSLVPALLCQYKSKPQRMPCTTTSASPSPSSPSTPPRPSTQSTATTPTGHKKSKMSAGTIAGIVVGVLIFTALLMAAVYYFCWTRSGKPFSFSSVTTSTRIQFDSRKNQINC